MKFLPVLALSALALAGNAPISTDSADSDSLVATFKNPANPTLKVLSNLNLLRMVLF